MSLLLGALGITTSAIAASVVSVTSQSDVAVAGDGECAISEAFGTLQRLAGGDCEPVVTGDAEPLTIRLQSEAEYLRTEALELTLGAFESVEVDGQGATIGRDPRAVDWFSLIGVRDSAHRLALSNLTLRDAEAAESPALDLGNGVAALHLERVSFIDNRAFDTDIGQGTFGAFFFGGGSIQITNCLFASNFSELSVGAVGLASVTGSITDSLFFRNSSAAIAGALRVTDSDLKIVRTVFSRNNAIAYGGAIEVSGNSHLFIEQSTFSNNNSDLSGGAIRISAPITIRNSLFDGNYAIRGGALHRDSLSSDSATIENSTFFDNSAEAGGAMWLEHGVTRVTGATIVANQATGNGGGILVANNPATAIVLDHSIVVGNSAPSDANCVGPRSIEGGYSLLGVQCGFDSRTGDTTSVGTGVVDSELRDNGGPTPTLAVTPGEAAHNSGDREYFQTTDTDQRGFPRVAEGRVDIGAHEYAAEAVDGLVNVLISASFENDEPRRFFNRQQFLDATDAADATGPFPGGGTVIGELTVSNITFIPFGTAALNFSTWTNALPDLGDPGSDNDLALSDFEQFDMRSQNPVTAFGFDFVDPGGDGTPFNLLACASTFDANSERCPIADIVFSMDFSAADSNRNFVGFQVSRAIQQVSIREQTNSNTNEFFGHVFTAP